MRSFSLDKILAVTTGRLVTRDHMDGLYEVMAYLTDNDGITTIGLMTAADACRDALLEQHPNLAAVEEPDFPINCTEEDIEEWLIVQEAIYGKTLPIERIKDYVPESDIAAIIRIRNGG